MAPIAAMANGANSSGAIALSGFICDFAQREVRWTALLGMGGVRGKLTSKILTWIRRQDKRTMSDFKHNHRPFQVGDKGSVSSKSLAPVPTCSARLA